jgi:hypothetical protein
VTCEIALRSAADVRVLIVGGKHGFGGSLVSEIGNVTYQHPSRAFDSRGEEYHAVAYVGQRRPNTSALLSLGADIRRKAALYFGDVPPDVRNLTLEVVVGHAGASKAFVVRFREVPIA